MSFQSIYSGKNLREACFYSFVGVGTVSLLRPPSGWVELAVRFIACVIVVPPAVRGLDFLVQRIRQRWSSKA